MSRRAKSEHTEDFHQIRSRCDWPEQVAYERIRSTVVFGDYVAETARHTGTPESTLRRSVEDFDRAGMLSLFDPEQQQQSSLDPETRSLILNLKAEYPRMRPNEIGTICYIRTGQRPHHRTIKKVLEDGPTAIRMFGRFYAYHDTSDVTERRKAVVTLHAEGWNVKRPSDGEAAVRGNLSGAKFRLRTRKRNFTYPKLSLWPRNRAEHPNRCRDPAICEPRVPFLVRIGTFSPFVLPPMTASPSPGQRASLAT